MVCQMVKLNHMLASHGQRLCIDPKSPLLSWMIEHVGVVYTLFSFDGHSQNDSTPFRKVKGRDHYLCWSKSIRRKPEEQLWDAELIKSL